MTPRPQPLKPATTPESASADPWAASFARSLDQQRSRAQQLLHTERERIRRIESTLTELIQELAGELLGTDSRLQQLEQEVGGRDAEIEQLRKKLTESLLATEAFRDSADDSQAVEALVAVEKTLAESQTEQEELRRQLARANKQLNLRAQELNELRAQVADLTTKQVDPEALTEAATNELVDLRAQRQDLIERLADAETRAKKGAQVDNAEVESLRKRFETAVQEVRELKKRNSELEQRAKSASTGGKTAIDPASAMDWESQKQRMLAKLEADNDDSPVPKQDRLTIEGTLRITDQVVAAKDEEIRELRQLLDHQSDSIGNVAVGAAAIAGILDHDDLIRQEREQLRALEAELREKLRKAEVDISLERAKLARDRSQMEERLQEFESERANYGPPAENDSKGGSNPPKKVGGRWLARLGLKDENKP